MKNSKEQSAIPKRDRSGAGGGGTGYKTRAEGAGRYLVFEVNPADPGAEENRKGPLARIRLWDKYRASLSLRLYAASVRIPAPEQCCFYKLGESTAYASAGASVAGPAPRRVGFPWQPDVLPVPKPRLLELLSVALVLLFTGLESSELRRTSEAHRGVLKV